MLSPLCGIPINKFCSFHLSLPLFFPGYSWNFKIGSPSLTYGWKLWKIPVKEFTFWQSCKLYEYKFTQNDFLHRYFFNFHYHEVYLLLVISSWTCFYSIKADRTTQLHFYGTADGLTTTANLMAPHSPTDRLAIWTGNSTYSTF